MSSRKRIVIIGGTGLIGSRTGTRLRAAGHAAIAASPQTGVDTLTGAGLDEVLEGCEVLVDVSNSPSFKEEDVISFFDRSGRNLLAAAGRAGVRHHIILSIVGVDRMPGNGYFRAKLVQESLVRSSGLPFTIVRSTQFLEFLAGIADASTVDGTVRLGRGLFQPIAADDVAAVLADETLAAPRNGIVEIAGPESAPLDEFVRRYLRHVGDPRHVVADPSATYFGGHVEELSLVPLAGARLGSTGFETWLARRAA